MDDLDFDIAAEQHSNQDKAIVVDGNKYQAGVEKIAKGDDFSDRAMRSPKYLIDIKLFSILFVIFFITSLIIVFTVEPFKLALFAAKFGISYENDPDGVVALLIAIIILGSSLASVLLTALVVTIKRTK